MTGRDLYEKHSTRFPKPPWQALNPAEQEGWNYAARLRKEVAGAVRWAVPPGYCGGSRHRDEPVPMIRADDIEHRLK